MSEPEWKILGLPEPKGYPHSDWPQSVYLESAMKRIAELEAELAPLEGRSALDHLRYTDSLEQWTKALLYRDRAVLQRSTGRLEQWTKALEAENQRLREALNLIERSTGGFANEVAKAALKGEDDESNT